MKSLELNVLLIEKISVIMEKEFLILAESVAESCQTEFLKLLESGNWESLGANNDVNGFSKKEGTLELIKSVGIINYDPESVSEYLFDLSNKKDWDEALIETKTLFDYGDLKIVQETFKAPWPVSPRDFVFIIKKFRKNDNIFFLAQSIDIGIPEQEGVIRGDCKAGGFYLKNIEDIATEMTYIVSVDPKGSIPTAIVNYVARQQVNNVNKIRVAMNSPKH